MKIHQLRCYVVLVALCIATCKSPCVAQLTDCYEVQPESCSVFVATDACSNYECNYSGEEEDANGNWVAVFYCPNPQVGRAIPNKTVNRAHSGVSYPHPNLNGATGFDIDGEVYCDEVIGCDDYHPCAGANCTTFGVWVPGYMTSIIQDKIDGDACPFG